ncbi:MAG: ABC transporter permease [Firmicutes bacterium]|nr:ABC transporter permease [Bacillota bacterium]
MWNQILSSVLTTAFLAAIFRITAPILFAALASAVSERAGVANIGLEGIMMISALFGVLFSAWTQNSFVGVLCAALIGALVGLMMGFFYLKLGTDIILAGIAVNLLGGGGTIFLLYVFTGQKGNSAGVLSPMLPKINIPFLNNIPVLGALSNQSVLTYVAFLCVILVFILFYKTPLGLKIRAVGENRDAAESVGVSVHRISYIALGISGFLAGLGGAYMSMFYSMGFNKDMVAGRGFIALAAQAMGRGEPLGTMLSSLLFGTADALSNNIAGTGLPSQLVATIPYVITIVGLSLYTFSTIRKVKRARKRRAL